MYHYKLKIIILGDEPFLSHLACEIKPLEQFEHEVILCREVVPEEISQGDILLSALSPDFVPLLRKALKADAYLIACARHEELRVLSDEIFADADDWWELPLDERLCAMRLSRLLEQVKIQKDAWLMRNYLDSAIDSVPQMIWFKDLEGHHVKVNDFFSRVVNKTKEDIAGKLHPYIWDIPEEEYRKGKYACKETDEAAITTGKPNLSMEEVMTGNGLRQFKTYKSPIFNEDGTTVIGTVGVAHDVTDLENISTELEILIQSIPFAVIVRDIEESIVNLNEHFCSYFGMARNEMLGKNFEKWEQTAFYGNKIINKEGYAEAVVRKDREENDRVLEIHEEIIYDVFHTPVGRLCIYRDVTRERALEKSLIHNTNTDFLTGLYNRRYFYKYIALYRAEQMVSILYLDLDRFKEVNDTFGHGAGDEALVLTANLLREIFPKEFVARLGGDEFVVALLGPHSIDTLQQITQRFLERMKEIFSVSNRLHFLSASVGISQTDNVSMNIDLLLQESDIALYEAKQSGRGQYRTYRRT